VKRNPFHAGVLSLLVPGLGQIYCGKGNKGAAILATAIVVGNLNLIFLLVFTAATPDRKYAWAYWILRIGHDVMSLWGIVFWIWSIADAYLTAKKSRA
jgi:TM2 domain-containing membrane protein YozV